MRRDRPRPPARTPGKWLALALAVAVHAAFIGVLVFSLRWQNRVEAPITAELYAPAAKAVVAEPPPVPVVAPPVPEPRPAPKPEPRPEPPPEPKPAPPKAQPKPEPKVDPPDPRAADIALKARQEQERKKREQAEREKQEREKKEATRREAERKEAANREAEKREAAKREADRRKADEDKRLADARERQAREADALRAQAAREQAALEARRRADAETAALSQAKLDYVRRIQSKVKGNVTLPPELPGNPEAIFEVVQLPTGEIIEAVLKKSSGVRAYDDAVQRAIVKSSPLPRPERPELFQRTLTLKFRPRED
ncbi:MAG: cell envelope integrity protein TolA [Betaproteobacteria bacterium]|nr:cell envelope integrity protein TolA [Betaproteobacteria bacterium]